MQKHHGILLASGISMLTLSLACMSTAFAAKPIELKFQSTTLLQSLLSASQTANPISFKYISTHTDMQHITHVRMQETYTGYPVWGAVAIIHTTEKDNKSLQRVLADSKATVNGVIYQDIQKDLQEAPPYLFSSAYANKALDQMSQRYSIKNNSQDTVKEKQSNLMVYIDENNKAHWAFLVSFEVQPEKGMLERPTYILDAMTFTIYHQWNDIKKLEETLGGGLGGNLKMGKLLFDGLAGHLPKLTIQRDPASNICYMANNFVTVKNYDNRQLMSFNCGNPSSEHDNIYWNADIDAANGGYSPSNDALYAGKVIRGMYLDWYGVPPLMENGKPMMLNMLVHMHDDNAYWDGKQMVFGDGISYFYPLTSLGVAGHEVSHGFTQQHSNLHYYSQSGGLNESFSDMAAQAAEYYSTGNNSWQIGPEIFKKTGEALRYMDEPTKDCTQGQKPGNRCSISHMEQYREGINVHYSSGIFNKVFYLLGTANGWNTKKAFDVMVKANMAYWTPNVNFQNAAHCVLKAAQDFNYDENSVKTAFKEVGIMDVQADHCQ